MDLQLERKTVRLRNPKAMARAMARAVTDEIPLRELTMPGQFRG